MVSGRDRRCRSGTSAVREHGRCSVRDKQELSASVDIHGVRGIDKPLSRYRGGHRALAGLDEPVSRAETARAERTAPHRIRDRSHQTASRVQRDIGNFPAIPRLYFARRTREDRSNYRERDGRYRAMYNKDVSRETRGRIARVDRSCRYSPYLSPSLSPVHLRRICYRN